MADMVDKVIQRQRSLRLNSGLQRLEQWAATAGQVDKNAIYKALFAIADGSAFHHYRIIHDANRMGELVVVVKDGLVVKIRFRHLDAFGIVHIGPHAEKPRVDLDAA